MIITNYSQNSYDSIITHLKSVIETPPNPNLLSFMVINDLDMFALSIYDSIKLGPLKSHSNISVSVILN